MGKTQPAFAIFEDRGSGPRAKEQGQPVEARKGKKVDSLLESPKRNAALPTLI